ncbi:TIGR01777 family protein [Echinicola soli]|uniref:TIGR01777 family protein n=1 Tax=Echinicola soli TaxID=2591634 RepID=A0A514CJJ1_9BACT|nr:TIGR01777 family oxidoreductase [Echinicola soli]QDH79988.1 TIGR01777 family protein [Echinicola soli]
MKKIVIAGGTGFLGKALIGYFLKEGAEITVLTRQHNQDGKRIRYVNWDGCTQWEWAQALNGADVLINLCGKSVDCRYTDKNKKEILRSRIDSTRTLGQAVERLENPPSIWINASSATIYPHTEGTANTEESQVGSDFSETVCKLWEEAFFSYRFRETRQIAIRSSMVFGSSGSVYQTMRRLALLGLGGRQGSGDQYVSWLHIDDFLAAIDFMVDNPAIEGVVNLCSPNPCRNSEFTSVLRQSLGAKWYFPLRKWMVEIGAFVMRTESELVLKSRRVIPKLLLDYGFKFKYSDPAKAFNALSNVQKGK